MHLQQTYTPPVSPSNNPHTTVNGLESSIHNRIHETMQTQKKPLTLSTLEERNIFIRSVGLPANNHALLEYSTPLGYIQSIHNPGLVVNGVSYKFYPEQTDKKDFQNGNIGWKIHLNVTPENTKKVTQYLIERGYYHKYFNGGELEDGKVYTVYIGSRNLTEQCAKSIHHDIGSLLAMPRSSSEVEFQAGIVGRFVAMDGSKYDQYGSVGIVYLDRLNRHRNSVHLLLRQARNINTTNVTEEEFKQAKIMLAQKARFTPGRMKDVGTVAHIYQNYQDMKSAGSQLSKIEERYREALKYCEEESFNELMKDFGAYFTG